MHLLNLIPLFWLFYEVLLREITADIVYLFIYLRIYLLRFIVHASIFIDRLQHCRMFVAFSIILY